MINEKNKIIQKIGSGSYNDKNYDGLTKMFDDFLENYDDKTLGNSKCDI